MNNNGTNTGYNTWAKLNEKYDDVMDTAQAMDKYKFIQFLAPYVYVEDKETGVKGTLEFTHFPRFYFDFKEQY